MSYSEFFSMMRWQKAESKHGKSTPSKAAAATRYSNPLHEKKKRVSRKKLSSIPVDTAVCRLLDLPPELRQEIYEYVLSPLDQTKTVKITTERKPTQPAILRTCKAIRNEACSIYYLDNKFFFNIKDFNAASLLTFCRQAGKYLDNIKIELHVSRYSKNWTCLLIWLKAYHRGATVRFQCADHGPRTLKPPACGGCAAGAAFDLVEETKDSSWSKVLRLLEIYKSATETTSKRWSHYGVDDEEGETWY
jgi:hypothetical protein